MTQAGTLYAKSADGALQRLQETAQASQILFLPTTGETVSTDDNAVVLPLPVFIRQLGGRGNVNVDTLGFSPTSNSGGSAGGTPVDDVYNPLSTNPQSGIAVASAIASAVGNTTASGNNLHVPGDLAVDGAIDASGGVVLPGGFSVAGMAVTPMQVIVDRVQAWICCSSSGMRDDMTGSMAAAFNASLSASSGTSIVTKRWISLAITGGVDGAIRVVGRKMRANAFSTDIIRSNDVSNRAIYACRCDMSQSEDCAVIVGTEEDGATAQAAFQASPVHWWPSDHTIYGSDKVAGDLVPGGCNLTVYGTVYLGTSRALLRVGLGSAGLRWFMIPDNPRLGMLFSRYCCFVLVNGRGICCGNATSEKSSQTFVMVGRHQDATTHAPGAYWSYLCEPVPSRLLPDGNDPLEPLGREVMNGEAYAAPMVVASNSTIPAAGGNVSLTVTPAIATPVYVANDTQGGNDVWCTQDVDALPATGGAVTLTLAANETGEPRELWVFVGHEYGECAVVTLLQEA